MMNFMGAGSHVQPMTNERRSGRTIGSVETAVSIVDHLQSRGPSGVTAIAESMGLPKSTVHKHLRTLVGQGYVRRAEGKYVLGFRFLEHGGVVRDRCRIYTYGREKVESLAADVEEMVILSIREGDQGVFLFRSNDRYNLRESLPLGARFDLHCNAAGKAMLAELDDESVRECIDGTGLPRVTDRTITDRDELIRELTTVRERGYALNRGERDRSVRSVSAVIADEKTGNVGAISISIPSDSSTAKYLDDTYAEAVQQVTSELSLQLKYS